MFVLGLVLAAGSVSGENPDRHLAADHTGSLCRESAFVHGYIHGYENGFRTGDLDIHLGHKPRALGDLKEFHRSAGYRPEFGDRGYFRLGYQQGFRAGYADVLRGGSFRGITQLRQAADGYGDSKARNKEFDQAVSAGYSAGHVQGLREFRTGSEFPSASRNCLSSRHSTSYCDGYGRGFGIGYADAIAARGPRRTEAVRAGIGR
jgi:hypothetical protein